LYYVGLQDLYTATFMCISAYIFDTHILTHNGISLYPNETLFTKTTVNYAHNCMKKLYGYL